MERPLIIHYHFFKNAGTSLDRTLQKNFGAAWTEVEGPGRKPLMPHELGEFVQANPWAEAISSHTALLPTPQIAGVHAIPVVFVRHPLDRLRSVYDFERRQFSNSPGSLKAKETDIAGYIEWRLARPLDLSAENFQVFRLARGTPGAGDVLERALSTVVDLPFVGLVEEYEASIEGLQNALIEYFPGIRLESYRSNVTADDDALDRRLLKLRQRLGEEIYERLVEANRYDLVLWETIRARYARTSPAP